MSSLYFELEAQPLLDGLQPLPLAPSIPDVARRMDAERYALPQPPAAPRPPPVFGHRGALHYLVCLVALTLVKLPLPPGARRRERQRRRRERLVLAL